MAPGNIGESGLGVEVVRKCTLEEALEVLYGKSFDEIM